MRNVFLTLMLELNSTALIRLAVGFSVVLCCGDGHGVNKVVGQDDQTSAQEDSIDRDYSSELPRIDPIPADEALRTFELLDGYEIELVASEPIVTDPVAMTFDEHGNLYVVEMRDYSEHPDESWGRIRQLVDTNRDGVYDEGHLFVEELSWPTAIIASKGGVYVAAAPDVFFFRDKDGDHIADERRTVFTGFGRSNVQGLINSFRWGSDNRIHGATSSSGGEITHVEQPDLPSVSLRGRDFAFDPLTETLEPVAGGGQHGLSFDSFGDKFVCANSNHIQYVIYDDRYLARNPYATGYQNRIDIAEDGPQADVFRTSPVEPWRTVRTRLRRQGIVPGPVERGGLAAGYFTGATGITIYRGDQWDEVHHGLAIIGDVGSNLVHRKSVSADGVAYRASRIDEASEFITSTDNWFRPVQFANGPDGALYILDMYREVIEHPASLHPVIKQHLDLDSGRERGRIYRVRAGSNPIGSLVPIDMAAVSSKESDSLAQHLSSRNGWTRETAARLLYERQELRAVPALQRFMNSDHSETVYWAMSALKGLESLDPASIKIGLRHEDHRIRRASIRHAESILDSDPEIAELVVDLAQDLDPRVRLQAAFSLGQMSGRRRIQTLVELSQESANDPWMLMAVHSSLNEGAGEALCRIADIMIEEDDSHLEAMRLRLIQQVGRQQRPEDVAIVLDWIQKHHQSHPQIVTQVIAEMIDVAESNTELARQFELVTSGSAQAQLSEMASAAGVTSLDAESDLEERLEAVHRLRFGDSSLVRDVMNELIDSASPVELQAAAIRVALRDGDRASAEAVLSRWPILSPRVRRKASEDLLTSSDLTLLMLDAILKGDLPIGDIDRARLLLLGDSNDEEILARMNQLTDQLALGDRSELVDEYLERLPEIGDVESGRSVFEKHCATCHLIGGVGHAIGPNLVAMLGRGDEAIVVNVIDPNREINPSYFSYSVLTKDGRVHLGMIEEETSTTITIRENGEEVSTMLRIDVEAIQSTGKSLMPEGLEREIDPQAMADLIEFLKQAG